MRTVLAAFSLVLFGGSFAQSDSLWTVWKNTSLPDSARLTAISALSWKAVFEKPDSGIALAEQQLVMAMSSGDLKARFMAYNTLAVGNKLRSDLPAALAYFERCLEVARQMNDRGRMANTFSNMSTVYKELGDQPKALDLLQQSLAIDTELGNKEGLAGTYNNIGNIYKRIGDHPKALMNYEKSAALFTELDRPKGRADALVSIGTMHNELGDRTKALEELMLAISIYEKLGSRLDLGKAYNNLGQIHGQMKRHAEAFVALDKAQTIFTELGNEASLCRTHYYRGIVLLDEGNGSAAVKACSKGAEIADRLDLLAQRLECSDCLRRAYAMTGDYRKGFQSQDVYITLQDSMDQLQDSKEVTRIELTHAFQQRQIADSLEQVRARFERELTYQTNLTQEKNRRNLLLLGGVAALLFAGGVLNRLRFTRRAKAAIEHEKERSDELLHNILPEEVATELKAKGRADARSFANVTVLFTDFKGFTMMAERLSPAELVAEIDHCFKGLDAIVEKYRVEKIKTIGDAYMAAAGLPDPTQCGPREAVMAALEMVDFIAGRRTELLSAGRPAFEMRVGLHSGPVIAGIVGVKKFAYDIWGDTVNVASRMESSGEPGQVNISGATYALVKDVPGLRFEARGQVEAKNKGAMEMYFVHRG